MKYLIFKAPRKKNDMPVETLNYEPNDFILGQKAIKLGPIVVLSEKDYETERRNNT